MKFVLNNLKAYKYLCHTLLIRDPCIPVYKHVFKGRDHVKFVNI